MTNERTMTEREEAAVEQISAAAPLTYAAVAALIYESSRDDDTKQSAVVLAARIIPPNADAGEGTDAETLKQYRSQALALAARRANDATKDEPTDPADLPGTGGLSIDSLTAATAADRSANYTDADRISAALALGDWQTRAACRAYIEKARQTDARGTQRLTLTGALIGRATGRTAREKATEARIAAWTRAVRTAAPLGLHADPSDRAEWGGPTTAPHVTPRAAALTDAARRASVADVERMRTLSNTTPALMGSLVLSLWIDRSRAVPEAMWSVLDAASRRTLASGVVEDDAHLARLRDTARSHALVRMVPARDTRPEALIYQGTDADGTPVYERNPARRAEAIAAAPRKSPKPKQPNRRSRATVTGATVTR